MEDEKKKKKNKKKKNKQNKASEGPAIGVGGEIASFDTNSSTHTHRNQDSTADVPNGDIQIANADLNGHCANGNDSSNVSEAEKEKWLQREAGLEERIIQLENEKELLTQKKANLEEKIKQIQDEKDSHMQKEADLEMIIVQLQTEKHSWIQKEVTLEGKIKQLLDENSNFNMKKAILEQKIELQERERKRKSWVLKENLSREIISGLNDDKVKLQGQVMELEEFRNSILHENQLLKENISSLHLQIKELEESASSSHASTENTEHASEHVGFNSQMEATTALVEKLTSDNADLVEKVNELYTELDRLRVAADLSSGFGLDKKIETQQNSIATDRMTESINNSSALGEQKESAKAVPVDDRSSQEAVPINDKGSQEPVQMNDDRISADTEHADQTAVILNSIETEDSGEIVQIPLDENEVRELELHAAERDAQSKVPLTDAPLIGAPFRFISFVAKYVSGADLVEKGSAKRRMQL